MCMSVKLFFSYEKYHLCLHLPCTMLKLSLLPVLLHRSVLLQYVHVCYRAIVITLMRGLSPGVGGCETLEVNVYLEFHQLFFLWQG